MRTLLVLALVAGCGGDDTAETAENAHEVVTCDSDWSDKAPGRTCEMACESFDGLTKDNAMCFGDSAGFACPQPSSTTWAGVKGCCSIHGDVVQFEPCH